VTLVDELYERQTRAIVQTTQGASLSDLFANFIGDATDDGVSLATTSDVHEKSGTSASDVAEATGITDLSLACRRAKSRLYELCCFDVTNDCSSPVASSCKMA
jgi:hypothetical protein